MTMKIQTLLAILCAMSLLTSTAFGQDQIDTTTTIEVDEVYVTATRSNSNIENLPINVAVINKRFIEENQPVSPVEALQYIPGVTRQSDGGLATTPIIRGLSRERAPILIDGNPFVGGRIRSYTLVDPFQIEQIEVVKGPASAFWGSDAVSGLVNVVTRKAENGYNKDFKIGGSFYGGFQSVADFTRGRVELEGRGNGFDFLIGGGLRDASNTNTPVGEIENSQFESRNFDLNIGYSLSENQRIGVSAKYFRNENVGFPGGLGAPGPPIVDRRFDPDVQRAINLSYDISDVSEKIGSIGARLFYKKQELDIDQVTNIFFPGTTDVNRRIRAMLDIDVPFWGGKFFATLKQKGRNSLTVGAEYLNEQRQGTQRDLNILIMGPTGMLINEINNPLIQIQPDSDSKSFGLFAIEELHFGDNIDLLLAIRYDNVSTSINPGPFDIPSIAEIFNEDNRDDNDSAVSGNLGIKYHASDNFKLTANVANSFRGTDLFSKYHFTAVGQGFLVPNPDLDPERGVFYELGAQYVTDKFNIEANYYQNSLNDLFVLADLTFAGSPSVQFQNIGEANINGFEWNARYQFGTLSHAFISGATISGNNDVTDQPLPQIPALQTWIGVHLRDGSNKFFIQPEVLIVGGQDDVAPNEQTTPGYSIFNIKAGLNLHHLIDGLPHAKLVISTTNLGDKEYRSHVSRGAPGNQNVFLEPGRSFNIGLVTRFGVADR